MNVIDTDLDALFNRLADGIASEADERRLGEMLRTSPEARRAYREFMALHSALHWDYVAGVGQDAMPMMNQPSTLTPARTRAGWVAAFLAGIAVATAAAVAIAVFWPERGTNPEKLPVVAKDEKSDSIAALLVDKVDAEFAKERGPVGVRFGPGEYEIGRAHV